MLAWGFGFWMWRQTLARGVLSLPSAEYSVVMCGASPGTLVTWPWLRLSMIYCFALRLWSQICVTCRSCWFPVSFVLSCFVGARCLWPVGWRHKYEMAVAELHRFILCTRRSGTRIRELGRISHRAFIFGLWRHGDLSKYKHHKLVFNSWYRHALSWVMPMKVLDGYLLKEYFLALRNACVQFSGVTRVVISQFVIWNKHNTFF